jgi:hypothetical protein
MTQRSRKGVCWEARSAEETVVALRLAKNAAAGEIQGRATLKHFSTKAKLAKPPL